MIRSAVAAFAVFLLLPAFAAAQPGEGLPALQANLLREQARREAAEIALDPKFSADPAKVIAELERQTNAAKINTPGTSDTAQARFDAVIQRRIAFQQEVETRQAEEGFDWANRSTAPIRFEIADAVILSLAIFVFFASLKLASKKSRLEIRKAQRLTPLIFLGILLPASGCDSPAPAAAPWAETRQAELREELKIETAKANIAMAKTDSFRSEALQTAMQNFIQAKVAQRMAQFAEEEKVKLDVESAALAQLRSTNRWANRGILALRICLPLLLFFLALLPYLRTRRKQRRQLHREMNTCPRCLAVDKFREIVTGVRDERYADTRVLECRSCEYRFRQSLQGEAKLCFPTVGIRSSGKTHLLATAYATVKAGKAKTFAKMQVAPSLGDDRFNVYIELILRQRGTAGATVHGQRAEDMPYPIILNVGDADRDGSQSVLVNLFDYSGEMMTESLDVGLLRRRAVLMDGFLLFFDPTQMYGDTQGGEATLSIEDQLKALADFSHDLRVGRGLRFGAKVDLPVAVILSKFDLVATHSPMGGQSLPFLEHIRTTLNPPGPVSLAMLKARSQTVEQMLPFMLPGVDLAKILRDSFGEHFLFFPTSDRGFAASHPAKVQIGIRPTPVPFGVLDPVLWLLHMHGYQALEESWEKEKGKAKLR